MGTKKIGAFRFAGADKPAGTIVAVDVTPAKPKFKTAEQYYEDAFYNPDFDKQNGNLNMKQRVVGIMEAYYAERSKAEGGHGL